MSSVIDNPTRDTCLRPAYRPHNFGREVLTTFASPLAEGGERLIKTLSGRPVYLQAIGV